MQSKELYPVVETLNRLDYITATHKRPIIGVTDNSKYAKRAKRLYVVETLTEWCALFPAASELMKQFERLFPFSHKYCNVYSAWCKGAAEQLKQTVLKYFRTITSQ